MLNMAKTEEEPKLDDDPKPRDLGIWNTIKIMVEEEAIDPAWRCPLYLLHRTGWINSEQREAGDKYQKLTMDYRRLMATDPEELPERSRELAYKRIEKAKERYTDAIAVLGVGRRVIDELVLQELHLGSERERLIARDGLQLLANFFLTGRTKWQRNVV